MTATSPALDEVIARNARDIALLMLQNMGYPKTMAERVLDSDPSALETFAVLAREHARRVLEALPVVATDPPSDSTVLELLAPAR